MNHLLDKLIKKYCSELNVHLNDHECDLIARSLSTLKSFDNWLDQTDLLEHRLSYFFSPHMCQDKSFMVFMTHPVFLRDILENLEINEYLHGPVTFVTSPISYYLFQEYPVRLYFDSSSLKSFNKTNQINWLDIGGLLIADGTVKISPNNLIDVKCNDPNFQSLIQSSVINKTALSLISPGVFKSDEVDRPFVPGDQLWDKKDRVSCEVSKVDPGEAGLILIMYNGDRFVSVSKTEFDTRYIRS